MKKTSLRFGLLLFLSFIAWGALAQTQGDRFAEPSAMSYQEYIAPFTASSEDGTSMKIFEASGNMLLEMLMSRAAASPPSGPGYVCKNETAVYTTAQGMSNYLWNVDGGTIIGPDNTYTITVNWSTPGTKEITVEYDEATAPGSKSVEVYYPEIVETLTPQEVCHDQWTTDIPLTGTGGNGISFKLEGGESIGLTTPSSASGIPSFKAQNTGTTPVTVTITVTPYVIMNIGTGVECLGTPKTVEFTVNPIPTPPTISPIEACNQDPVAAIPLPQVPNISYSWTGGSSVGLADGTSETGIDAFTADNGGTTPVYADVQLSVTYTSGTGVICEGTIYSTFRITVYPKPSITTPPTDMEVCHNKDVPPIPVPSTGSLIRWFGGEDIGLANGESGSIQGFKARNYTYSPVSATITVIPIFRSGSGMECEGDQVTFIITVNPTPEITSPLPDIVECDGESIQIQLSSNVLGTTFHWEGGGDIGLVDGSDNAQILFTADLSGATTAITRTIKVTPTYTSTNGENCSGEEQTFKITVLPKPEITSSLINLDVCHNDPVNAIALTSTVPGTIYSWTGGDGIGLTSASSNAGIPGFIASNSSYAPVTATIYITPKYVYSGHECIGDAINFNITVNPKPDITSPLPDITVCNEETVNNILLSSNISGTIFSWSGGSSIGLVDDEGTEIPSFPATISGTTPVTVTITVIPKYVSSEGAECSGVQKTFKITVIPMPEPPTPIADIDACHNDPIDPILLSGTPGTLYSWTGGDDIGLISSNSYTAIPAFTATNAGYISITKTITVTPVFTSGEHSCEGDPITFNITVNPMPDISTILENITVCNEEMIGPISLSSNIPGTVFNWSGGSAVGLIDDEGTQIPQFQASISGTSPTTVTVTVVPKYVSVEGKECEGTPKTFTIMVIPVPETPAPIADIDACHNDPIQAISLTGTSGATYSWTGGEDIGLMNGSSTTAIPTFTATNASYSPISRTIRVTPTLTSGGFSCEGDYIEFNITVNPRPIITNTLENLNICNEATVGPIILSANVTGTEFHWSGGSTIGLVDGNNPSQIPSFSATISGTTPVTATITVIPRFTGANAKECDGEAKTFTITVHPNTAPEINGDDAVCVGLTIDLSANISGGVWSSSNELVATVSPTGVVTGVSAGPATITYEAFDAYGCGGSDTHEITVYDNPTPVISGESNICRGYTTTLTASVPGGSWVSSNPAIARVMTSDPGAGTAVIEGVSVGGPVTITYTVTVDGCTGTATYEVTVLATPVAEISGGNTVCFGNDGEFIITITAGAAPWEVTYTDGTTPTTITVATSPHTVTLPGLPVGVHTYTLSSVVDANGCEAETVGMTGTATITVNELPEAEISGGNTVCFGNDGEFIITITAGSAPWEVTYTDGTTPTTITVTTSPHTVTLPGLPVGVHNYTLSSVVDANGCEAETVGMTGTATIVVEEPPVAEITDTPPTICNNESYTVNGALADNGTILWTSDGAGTITGETTLTPTYTAAVGDAGNVVTLMMTVTSDNTGCAGETAIATLEITVNPEPTITNLPEDYTLCNGEETVEVTFEGVGTRWEWEVTEGNIGMATTSGTNTFPAQTVSNTTDAVISATITVTPVYEEGGEPCYSLNPDPYTFTISVNPQPTVVNLPEDYALCNGATTTPVTFEGVATQYQWVNIGNPIEDIPTGIQEGNFGAYKVANPTTTPMIARIQVTPIYGENSNSEPCMGDTASFTITVLPTPTVTNANDLVYCNNIDIAQLWFNGTATEWYWEQTSGPDIGLPVASGTNSMPEFTPTNDSNVPITAYFSVMPKYVEGDLVCEADAPTEFSITVTPNIIMNHIPADTSYCHHEKVAELIFSSNVEDHMVYYWKYVSGDIIPEIPESGEDFIPGFEAQNPSNDIISATYQVMPVYASVERVCEEDTTLIQEFTITILPRALVDDVSSDAYCAGDMVPSITFTGNTASEITTYMWEKVGGADIGSDPTGVNIFPAFETINEGTVPLTAFYRVTPIVTYKDFSPCEGEPKFFSITVTPMPTLTSPADGGIVCSGSNFTYVITTDMEDIGFSWKREAVDGINGGKPSSGNTAVISEPLTNNTLEPITVVYSLTFGLEPCMRDALISTTVYPDPSVQVDANIVSCKEETEVLLPYSTEQKVLLFYKITYSQAAHQVGFSDELDFNTLYGDVAIAIPEGVKSGVYSAWMHVKVDECDKTVSYPFSIEILQQTKITAQTNEDMEMCIGYPITLNVLAEGTELSYSWYKNGVLITSSEQNYFTISKMTQEDFGRYYVKVFGKCGEVTSDTIEVKQNPLSIVHSENVLSLATSISGIIGYQWYKAGASGGVQALYNETDSVYNAPLGLSGTYYVEVTYRDGTKEMSCPLAIYTEGPSDKPSNSIKIYPNPAGRDDIVYVEIDMNIDEMYGAEIKIFDVLGKLIITQPVSDKATAIDIYNLRSGIYVVIVESTLGRVISEKLIVR